jgi:GTP pyrophosphokinase
MTLPCEPGVDTSQKAAEAGSDQGLRAQVLFDGAGHAGAGPVLRRAYDIAAACHDGQLRLSGDPYITHPVEVALICQDLGMSPAVQCAALLHDVLDTAYTTGQLHSDFSSEIAGLVEEVTRLDRSHYRSTAEANDQVQAVRDPRVQIIKLADRLHNMRTLRYVPLTKQQRKSYEVLECFAPLARGLGLDAVARELADLAHQSLAQHLEDQASQSTLTPARAPVLSSRVLAITSVLLPRAGRDRWLEEWIGELSTLPTRRHRARFTIEMLTGMPRLAAVLRCQITPTGPHSDGHHAPAGPHQGVVPLPPEPSNRTLGEMP